MECMWRREIQRRLFHVQTLYQWLRAGCEPVASGSIPVRHHPDHRGLYRCHDRYAAGSPGIGVVLGGQGEVKDASGACCPSPCRWPWCWCWAPPMASAKACKKALAAIATLAHDKKSAILVTTFVSTICCWLNWGFGLIAGACWPRLWPAGYGMWIIPADCLRLFRLCDLARRPVGSIPLQIGARAPRCLELYTRPRLLPLYFTR